MTIPGDFQFSQASLQDHADCRRRFELRYLLEIVWPANLAEPALENEHQMRLGREFHRLVHQYLLGISAERLTRLIAENETLRTWWENYLIFARSTGLEQPFDRRIYAEVTLSAPLAGRRLIAKYDLITIQDDGQVRIYDWKTYRTRPQRSWLAGRLQTHVYPYILVVAGAQLNQGEPINADAVEMVYWFANDSQQPERFTYDREIHQENSASLEKLLLEIQSLEESNFVKTENLDHCRFCVYRSLCNRGTSAGSLEEIESLLETAVETGFDIDFDQIGEIEY